MNTELFAFSEENPPNKEKLLDALAGYFNANAMNEAEIARIVYVLRSFNLTPSAIVREMHKRHSHSISSSWVVRLQRIYEWWVVRHGFKAEEVFRYSKNKLYAMALHGIADWDYLVANGEKSDKDFISQLRASTGATPESVIVNIPYNIKGELEKLAARLSALTNSPVSTTAAMEFVIEVGNTMPDDMIIALWQAVHGEFAPQMGTDNAGVETLHQA